MSDMVSATLAIVTVLTDVLLFFLGVGILAIIAMYVVDTTQSGSAIRRKFPVIGRFR